MGSNPNEGMDDGGSVSNSQVDLVEGDDSERSSRSLGGGGESVTSGTSGYASTAQGGGRKAPDHFVAKEESKAVALSRILVLLVLCASASVAGVTTYILSKKAETAGFRLQFEDFADEIADVSQVNAENIYGLMDSFSSTITSFALSTDAQWPFVTIPHFEVRGEKFFNVSSARLLAFAPVVSDKDVGAWNRYSVQEQGWIAESYRLRGDTQRSPNPIHDQVYRTNDSGQEEVVLESSSSSGVEYTPLWQEASAPTNVDGINYNLFSNSLFRKVFDFARMTRSAVLSAVINPSTLFGEDAGHNQQDSADGLLAHPDSILVQNVYETFDERERNVVAALIAVLPWKVYFEGLLQHGANGLICVLRDTCGTAFTYRLDGPKAVYLGQGDHHEAKYDDLEFVRPFAPFIDYSAADAASMEAHCEYSLHIFPSSSLEKAHQSRKPIIFTIAVVSVFFFTSMIFVTYDFLVQQRQQKVQAAADKSHAIVSALFPAEIRDRLFQHNEEPEQNPNSSGNQKSKGKVGVDGAKSRLKNFLDGGDTGGGGANEDKENELVPEMFDTKPIADLFPNTTVMFADIAGFTAWSSVREPSQVFTLLETVYRAFDLIAKRRRVFKVETVGDCYVAVTGLPEPRKDHAVAMGRFARDCMNRMNELSHQLEITLGPDTGDLAMRFGLHSGPVTAGVLRGDKSRFQLFGDTVNTAARIESTGLRNRIHISQETATLLEAADKGHWVRARDDCVVAKGKGEMKTFWLMAPKGTPCSVRDDPAHDGSARPTRAGTSLAKKADNVPDAMPGLSEIPARVLVNTKMMRLVDWNVDVLQRILRLIIAKRRAQVPNKTDVSGISKMEQTIGKVGMTLGEVSEIIILPNFDADLSRQRMDPNNVQISETVMSQLREYVKDVASLYRENPFHNLEHASHVTMSTLKLLSRIVAPDIDETDKNLEASLHDHTYGITSDPLTQFAVVLSAMVHDADHVGIPNFLLITENQQLSSTYKNKSIAEQNSIDLAWTILMKPQFSELRCAIYDNENELRRFRQLLVNTVLATDIFDKELQTLRKNRWDKAFNPVAAHQDGQEINRKATIVIEHLIQASDVAHTMQHWHIYQKWNERLFAEMMSAYRAGRSPNDPSLGWYQGELGFFDNYIIPLAKKLKDCGVFGVSSDEYLNYAMENRSEWASKGEEVVKKLAAKFAPVEPAEPTPTPPTSN